MHEPAGFWRRAFALLIDTAICAVLLTAFAAALFVATDGRSQYVGEFRFGDCQPVNTIPPDLVLPPGFEPNFATECRYSFFGLQTARVLSVGRRTVNGNFTTTLVYDYRLDANGAVVPGAVAGNLSPALVVLFRLLFDSVARSPGRRLCGLAVADRATGERARFGLLWRRYLLFSLPVGLTFLPNSLGLFPVSLVDMPGFIDAILFGPLVLSAALSLWALVSVVRRRPAFYDRPVGTTVLRR